MALSSLAGLLHCDNSNVTGIADRLEAAGLIERRPSETDRRVKTLALTARGTEMRDAVIEVMAAPPPPIAALSEEDADAARRAAACRRLGSPRCELSKSRRRRATSCASSATTCCSASPADSAPSCAAA
jgi:DNA-binding MarR family transcriptional regulator